MRKDQGFYGQPLESEMREHPLRDHAADRKNDKPHVAAGPWGHQVTA